MELMSRYPDKYFDLAIVDPPYGIGASKFIGTTYKKGTIKNKKGFGNNKLYLKKDWDNAIPDEKYFNELFRVSKNQIIWGGNYFPLPLVKGWIFWHKKIANATTENYADGELAWTSINKTARYFKYDWVGLGGINNGRKSEHPTQKPVALYKWLLDKYAKEGDKILDTHLGSGSIAIACHDFKFDLTACELDKEYFDKAMERINNHKSQLKLF
jgi:site-specific DNA-methyltransferase (adenine-specific)